MLLLAAAPKVPLYGLFLPLDFVSAGDLLEILKGLVL